jgi:uncharacterized protein (DUF983 family)
MDAERAAGPGGRGVDGTAHKLRNPVRRGQPTRARASPTISGPAGASVAPMPSTGTLLARGLGRRCPRCGSGRLFTRWFRLAQRCPRCRLEFEHEEGYWVGAMIVNIAVAELAFGVTFAAGLLITWPDVPWGLLTIVCVAVNAAVPLLFYPWSKTIWMAIDGVMNPDRLGWDGDRPGHGATPR